MSLYRSIAADARSVGIEVLDENMIRVDEECNLEIMVDDQTHSSVYTKKPYIMSVQFDQFAGIAKIFSLISGGRWKGMRASCCGVCGWMKESGLKKEPSMWKI